jgi:hypothetical protein
MDSTEAGKLLMIQSVFLADLNTNKNGRTLRGCCPQSKGVSVEIR